MFGSECGNVRSLAETLRRFALIVCSAFALLLVACGDPKPKGPSRASRDTPGVRKSSGPVDDSGYLKFERIGKPMEGKPWIAHVNTIDLDQNGLLDVVGCDAGSNTVFWIRQISEGVFEEVTVGEDLQVPVRVEYADMDGDGDLDLLVASMGAVFPNNDRIGEVFILENDGAGNFTKRTVIEHTARVTDVRAGDFNGDGRLDLALAQFGYDQGEVSWLERTGEWTFEQHVLFELSGAINVGVADFNGDRHLDIVVNISQQWEEIHYFENRGDGNFTRHRLWGSANEDYGSSGMQVADLNGNGRPDILFSNGDGFGPAATPGPRPWHGLQWLENLGSGAFRYHRIGDLMGAYSPVAVDLDRDGHMDVVSVAGYADWKNKNREVVSLMWFRNDGKMRFEPRILSRYPKDLITLAAGSFEGDGEVALVTGGFYIYPPYEGMERILLWRRTAR